MAGLWVQNALADVIIHSVKPSSCYYDSNREFYKHHNYRACPDGYVAIDYDNYWLESIEYVETVNPVTVSTANSSIGYSTLSICQNRTVKHLCAKLCD